MQTGEKPLQIQNSTPRCSCTQQMIEIKAVAAQVHILGTSMKNHISNRTNTKAKESKT